MFMRLFIFKLFIERLFIVKAADALFFLYCESFGPALQNFLIY